MEAPFMWLVPVLMDPIGVIGVPMVECISDREVGMLMGPAR
jgi:hypothetical protein